MVAHAGKHRGTALDAVVMSGILVLGITEIHDPALQPVGTNTVIDNKDMDAIGKMTNMKDLNIEHQDAETNDMPTEVITKKINPLMKSKKNPSEIKCINTFTE